MLRDTDNGATPLVPQGHNGSAPQTGDVGPPDFAGNGLPKNADIASVIDSIRYHHRIRNYAMEQRKRADLSLGAFLKTALGWSVALPNVERDRIAGQAQALIEIGEKDAKGKLDVEEPAYDEWREVILSSIAARAPFDAIEKSAKKQMTALAKSLPVWKWAAGVRGLSAMRLAVIVGEAGNLSDYPKKGHLWKRMGLAVMGSGDGSDDIRQGRLRKGASADEWILHGYSPKRRSQMYVIGDVMVKVGDHYRRVYLNRKEYERGKLPDDTKPIVLHRRAQRYMEKILLRDLWQEWKRLT